MFGCEDKCSLLSEQISFYSAQ